MELKYSQIVQDEKLLRVPCYQVDVQNPSQIELARRVVLLAESVLFIDPDKGCVKGNLLGYGLSSIQMKDLYADTLQAKNDKGELPRVGIIRVPSLLKGHSGLSLDMINPQLIDAVAPYNYKGEGCLSFPGRFYSTRRFRAVTLGFIDAQSLKPRELRLYGLEATVAQHEIDHQDGILFIDRANIPVKRDDETEPNDPCPVCVAEGKKIKWKKCEVHNV